MEVVCEATRHVGVSAWKTVRNVELIKMITIVVVVVVKVMVRR